MRLVTTWSAPPGAGTRLGPGRGARPSCPGPWQRSPEHPLGEGPPSSSQGLGHSPERKEVVAEPGLIAWETACAMGVPAPRTPCPQPWRVLAGPGPRAWALVSVLPPVLPFHLVLSRQVFPRPSCGSARSRVLGSPLRSAAAWRVAPGSAFSRGAGARTHRSGPGCGAACFLSADFPLLVSAACGASSSLNPELGRCPRSTGFWGSSGWGVGGRGEESWP